MNQRKGQKQLTSTDKRWATWTNQHSRIHLIRTLPGQYVEALGPTIRPIPLLGPTQSPPSLFSHPFMPIAHWVKSVVIPTYTEVLVLRASLLLFSKFFKLITLLV